MADQRLQKRCEYCNASYLRTNHRFLSQRFCTRACARASARKDPATQFWKRVHKTDTCWLWTGPVRGFGYGSISVQRRTVSVHRFSWQLHFGPIPAGLQVCHRCDVPSCVNPAHLFLGTQRDNLSDMVRKGRQLSVSGESVGTSKLTEATVQKILQMLVARHPQREIAAAVGIGRVTISDILHQRSWRSVPRPRELDPCTRYRSVVRGQ